MLPTITSRIIIVLASALLLAACASSHTAVRGPAPEANVTVDEAAAAFRALAFTTIAQQEETGYEFLFAEYERARSERRTRLVKWPAGAVLRIYHTGLQIPVVKPRIEKAMDEVSQLTSIPHSFQDSRKGANFIVNVEIEEKEALQCGSMGVVRRYRPKPHRFDSYLERPPFTLYGFGISLDTDADNCCISHVIYQRMFAARPIFGTHLSIDNLPIEEARTCALAHYMRAVGFNITRAPVDSLLSVKTDVNEPTELDVLLIWVMYDPRLKSGMSPDEVMPIVRQILTEALGEGAEAATENNS